jgi:hypothetical protein
MSLSQRSRKQNGWVHGEGRNKPENDEALNLGPGLTSLDGDDFFVSPCLGGRGPDERRV